MEHVYHQHMLNLQMQLLMWDAAEACMDEMESQKPASSYSKAGPLSCILPDLLSIGQKKAAEMKNKVAEILVWRSMTKNGIRTLNTEIAISDECIRLKYHGVVITTVIYSLMIPI